MPTRLLPALIAMILLPGSAAAEDPLDSDPRVEPPAAGVAVTAPFFPKLAPDVDGALRPIPLDVHPGTKRAYITARVNGVEGRFFLDTGLSDTILDSEFAAKAGISEVAGRLPIIAGNYGKLGSTLEFVRVADLEIAGTHFRNFHAVRKSLQGPRRDFSGKLAGNIGANVLLAKPVTFDYRRQSITFPTEISGPHDFSFDLVLDRPAGVPKNVRGFSSMTAVVRADIDGVQLPLMLDSGAAIGDMILVNEPYHAAMRKLAGNPDAYEYRAKEVRVANKLILTDQHCRLLPFAKTVIGSEFFDRHVITVDISAGKVWLDRNPPVKTNKE